MNYFISDLHFGHANVIRFDDRPFADVDEMDRCMIENWRARVREDDDVWIVGDFCYRSSKGSKWYLEQLPGRKRLVVGNHDYEILKRPEATACFASIEKLAFLEDGDRKIILCHFPIAEWKGMQHGTWHIYGHIHNRRNDTYQFMKTRERALNAAASINHYTPSTFEELVENNRIFQRKDENGSGQAQEL